MESNQTSQRVRSYGDGGELFYLSVYLSLSVNLKPNFITFYCFYERFLGNLLLISS